MEKSLPPRTEDNLLESWNTFVEPLHAHPLFKKMGGLSLISAALTLTAPNGLTRDWFVPAEVESGWNLGRLSKDNPNGIGHPLNGRKRIETPTWESWKL